jgi:hypothetical protein
MKIGAGFRRYIRSQSKKHISLLGSQESENDSYLRITHRDLCWICRILFFLAIEPDLFLLQRAIGLCQMKTFEPTEPPKENQAKLLYLQIFFPSFSPRLAFFMTACTSMTQYSPERRPRQFSCAYVWARHSSMVKIVYSPPVDLVGWSRGSERLASDMVHISHEYDAASRLLCVATIGEQVRLRTPSLRHRRPTGLPS